MPIKVLIVEDSFVALTILKRILNSAPDIEVLETATNGVQGLELVAKLKPNVICTDLHMPKMNGLEFTQEVMALYPTPILVISASVQDEDTHHVFRLLDAGAVDIFPKPRSGQPSDYDLISQPLINKIRLLSGIKVFRKNRKTTSSFTTNTTPTISPNVTSNLVQTTTKIIAIGSSTGGPQALVEILSTLPANFPTPIVCVQHISDGFLGGLVDWLGNSCRLKVKIAQTGEKPEAGNVYFPPERHHLEFDSTGRFFCFTGMPVSGHCPSVTVTFKGVAKAFGKNAIGILLTGMGRDGADGLLSMYQVGAYTIAQDETTSVVFGMPQEAIKLGATKKVLPIGAIATHLISLLRS